MAPELRSSAEKKAPEPAESSTIQGQATASGSSSTGTTAMSQQESLRDFMEFLTRRDENERKRQEQRDEDERRRQEQRDEDERRRQERRDEAFNQAFNQSQQQLTSVIMSLAASLTGQNPVAPAHPATPEAVAQASPGNYPSDQSDQPAPFDPATQDTPATPVVKGEDLVETITLVAFHAEAACEVTGEENRETLAKTQKVDQPSVTAHSTTVKADTQAPVPTQSAQAVDAATAVRSSVKERDSCRNLLSFMPVAKVPYTRYFTVMRTDWLSRPPDLR